MLRRAQRAIANGYRNWKYGSNYQPAFGLGAFVAYFFPGVKRVLDLDFRLMPKAWPGAKLLDVGFGNGAFLEMALAAGWDCAGVDMDPIVVRNAKAKGLNVRMGSIDAFANYSEQFDVITISHVVEHLYSPIDALRLAHKLLKPGGRLWLDTPNIESLGHARYGRHWRGLEPPRHLVIFGPKSIRLAMGQAGFCTWQEINRAEMTQPMFLASEQIQRGTYPLSDSAARADWQTRLAAFKNRFSVRQGEYLTFVAHKKVGTDENHSR